VRRRRFIQTAATAAAVAAVDAACTIQRPGHAASGSGGTGGGSHSASTVRYTPAAGATGINPTAPVSLSLSSGQLGTVTLTNAAGKPVAGVVAPDGRTFTTSEPLGYGATYTWSGAATGADRRPVVIEGSFSTLAPAKTTAVNIQIADGQTVGIAAPIILQFNDHVADKAAVERALTVTTTPPQAGGWAWLPDDRGSRVHYRPQEYWQPNTKVHVDAKLYGVAYGDGAYGLTDLTSDFAIGRSQIVKASAPTHRVQVYRDDQVVFDFPCSYGEGNAARNTTRSGIHVVTEKYQEFSMSNPPFYTNAKEHWAVRISNNGEFIHANPMSAGAQGNTNVTNGCINLSTENAESYFPTAMYGDPVEVTGTDIALSAADGDIYDWVIDWPTWRSMSALRGATTVSSVAPSGQGN
jgi:lipoprotein-anchoring transpeptidase ErfK/SrfK